MYSQYIVDYLYIAINCCSKVKGSCVIFVVLHLTFSTIQNLAFSNWKTLCTYSSSSMLCGGVSALRRRLFVLEFPCPPGFEIPIRLCRRPLAKDTSWLATFLLHARRAWMLIRQVNNHNPKPESAVCCANLFVFSLLLMHIS